MTDKSQVTAADSRHRQYSEWSDYFLSGPPATEDIWRISLQLHDSLANAVRLLSDEQAEHLLAFLDARLDDPEGNRYVLPTSVLPRLAALNEHSFAALVVQQIADAVDDTDKTMDQFGSRWFAGDRFQRHLATAEAATQFDREQALGLTCRQTQK